MKTSQPYITEKYGYLLTNTIFINQDHSLYDSMYRFGFQGQEMDNEIKGTGNSINYAYRVHDPRLGRFLSIDPLSNKFPWNSPYAFSENRVIDGIELEGLEWKATKDKEGNYSDFEWDPDNAYDDDGNLNDGYFKTAVKFTGYNNEKIGEKLT